MAYKSFAARGSGLAFNLLSSNQTPHMRRRHPGVPSQHRHRQPAVAVRRQQRREGEQWKEWEGRPAVGYAGIGIHGTPTGNRIEILDVSKDGLSSARQELSWLTFAGRLRNLSLGPDKALYVADEASGMI